MLTVDVAADIVGSGIKVVIMLVCVLVVPSLLVGLCVSIFQAVTQINEQTLSFLPRLLVMLVTIIVGGPWVVQKFMEYIINLYTNIPQLIG